MIGSVIGGRFRLEREAGSGGMGTVYRAQDLLAGGEVALKLLTSEEVRDAERFVQEAGILARLSHPAIVRYVAHGSAGGQHFLAMEWLEGIDLDTHIDQQPLSLQQGLLVLRRTTEALAYAHAEGVIHRDLKPQNLFLPNRALVDLKLLDFGVARLTRVNRRLTQTGVMIGTPGYLAPEIISGAREVDGRADLFSLGCLVYRCLAGRPPFEADDASALLAQILLHDPPALSTVVPSVPPALADLVGALLAKDPDERPASAAAVLSALEALAHLPDAPAEYTRRRTDQRLTLTEKRLTAAVLIGGPPGQQDRAKGGDLSLPAGLAAEVKARLGADLQDIGSGAGLVLLPPAGRSTDVAARAAQAALALRPLVPDRPLCLTCGQVSTGDGAAGIGPLVEAGLAALAEVPAGRILVQGIAAALIDGRFEVVSDSPYVFLESERQTHEDRRRVFGKASAFLGRGREMAALAGMLTACAEEGTAQAALVLGNAGIGKSRLLQEFLDQARRQNPSLRVFYGAGDSLAAGSPFGMVARALRRHADVRDGEPIEDSRRKLVAFLAERVPESALGQVAAFLGEIAHIPFPDDQHESLRAARANPQLMGDLIRRAFEDWLSAETEDHPLLFVLDDLHWGDAGTAGLFDAVLRNLPEQSLMVLALARPEVRQNLPDLWVGRGVQTVELGPLPRKLAEKLVREGVGPDVADPLVIELVARGDGNPFFLEELIRAAREGRTDALPDTVVGMVQARLDAEGDKARQVLRAASIFGERFSRSGLLALLGGEAEATEVGAWLDRLTARELIARGSAPDGAEGELVFCHALIREAAYAALTEGDLVLGHRLAGSHLESAGCPDPMVLAEHFRRGIEPVRAVRWYREAAEQALRASDLPGAIGRAHLGLGQLEAVPTDRAAELPAESGGALRLTQAEAHLWRGELAEAEQRGNQATAALSPGHALWFRAAGQTLISVAKQGKVEALLTWVARARGEAAAPGAQDAQALCLAWAASFLLVAARLEEAEDLITWTQTQAEALPHPDPQVLALLEQARAARASLLGDPAACLAALEGAREAFERAGDSRNVAAVRSNIGFVLGELGAWQRAESALREALTDAERLGLVELRAVVQHNLGRVLAYRGELAEAERLERVAIDSFVAQGEPRLEGLARIYMAEIKLLAGAPKEAESQAEIALRVLTSAPTAQVQARALLARAHLAQGQVEPALESATRAADELEVLGSIDEGEADVRLVLAECLAACGQAQKARIVVERAKARLCDRSSRIVDEELRSGFLTAVPAHVRTVNMAQALSLAGAA